MAVVECLHCGRDVVPKNDLCPTCGQDATDLTDAPENRRRREYRDVMSRLAEGGKSKTVVRDFMVREVGAAPEMVDDLLVELDPFFRRSIWERGPRHLLVGLFWVIGGAAITAGTLLAAEVEGGAFLLAWGPMAFGAILFGSGVVRFLCSRRRIQAAA